MLFPLPAAAMPFSRITPTAKSIPAAQYAPRRRPAFFSVKSVTEIPVFFRQKPKTSPDLPSFRPSALERFRSFRFAISAQHSIDAILFLPKAKRDAFFQRKKCEAASSGEHELLSTQDRLHMYGSLRSILGNTSISSQLGIIDKQAINS